MQLDKPLAIPWNHRLRRWSQRTLPWLCFLGSLAACAWLWEEQAALPSAVGEVEALRVRISSRGAGRLVPLSDRAHGRWELFDRVSAGQVIARLDYPPVIADLQLFQEQATRLSRQLQTETELTLSKLSEDQQTAYRAAQEYNLLQLGCWQQGVEMERARIALARLKFDHPPAAAESAPEVSSGTTELEQAQVRLMQLERSVESMQAELLRRAEAVHPLAASQLVSGDPLETHHEEMAQLRLQWETLQSNLGNLTIKSPISGTLVAIDRWPGQTLLAGDPIVTVAAEQGRHVVSYISEHQRVVPRAGGRVRLRTRAPRAQPIVSTVEIVGPQVEEIPPHLAAHPNRPEWGVPIRIRMPRELDVRPGSLVDVIFTPRGLP